MPLTEDFTYQLGDDGVLLNADDFNVFPFFDVQKVEGLDSAPFRITKREHEGADGGFVDAEFEQARLVVVRGIAYGEPASLEVYLDALKENFAPSTVNLPFYLKAPGVAERVLWCKPTGARYDLDQARRIGTTVVDLSMICEDPRFYDNDLQTVTVPYGGTITTGFTFPFAFNFSFGAPVVGGSSAVATNQGNRPAPAIITIYGPVLNPRITNNTTGNTLRFNDLELFTDDTLVIDLKDHTVVLNGSANRRGYLVDPDWFFLAVGQNDLTLQAEGGTAGVTRFDITFRSAWR